MDLTQLTAAITKEVQRFLQDENQQSYQVHQDWQDAKWWWVAT